MIKKSKCPLKNLFIKLGFWVQEKGMCETYIKAHEGDFLGAKYKTGCEDLEKANTKIAGIMAEIRGFKIDPKIDFKKSIKLYLSQPIYLDNSKLDSVQFIQF